MQSRLAERGGVEAIKIEGFFRILNCNKSKIKQVMFEHEESVKNLARNPPFLSQFFLNQSLV